MALQERLDRFKKQQEKFQSALTSIASKKATATLRIPSAAASAPAPAVKFSNDTERLQHINSIRKSPVGAQIKRVIDLLLKSKHALKDKNELSNLIRKFSEGIPVIDLKYAYPTVEDLQALKAVGEIWLLSNFDAQEDIGYPNYPRLLTTKVYDDLKQLFRGIELPRDMMDIERDLQKNGMKPATDTANRRALAQSQGISNRPKPKKKHEISKRTKLTNAHLPELFQNLKS